MKVAIVKSNGIIDKKIERVLVSNKIKGDFIDKVTRNQVVSNDFIIFCQSNSLPNLPKVIERIVIEKKSVVILISKNINMGQFYNVINSNYFFSISDHNLESELITTFKTASKFINIMNSLYTENAQLLKQIKMLKDTNSAKRILISKGLSEADAHSFIQKKAMDLRISKKALVNLIIENKIDI